MHAQARRQSRWLPSSWQSFRWVSRLGHGEKHLTGGAHQERIAALAVTCLTRTHTWLVGINAFCFRTETVKTKDFFVFLYTYNIITESSFILFPRFILPLKVFPVFFILGRITFLSSLSDELSWKVSRFYLKWEQNLAVGRQQYSCFIETRVLKLIAIAQR